MIVGHYCNDAHMPPRPRPPGALYLQLLFSGIAAGARQNRRSRATTVCKRDENLNTAIHTTVALACSPPAPLYDGQLGGKPAPLALLRAMQTDKAYGFRYSVDGFRFYFLGLGRDRQRINLGISILRAARRQQPPYALRSSLAGQRRARLSLCRRVPLGRLVGSRWPRPSRSSSARFCASCGLMRGGEGLTSSACARCVCRRPCSGRSSATACPPACRTRSSPSPT